MSSTSQCERITEMLGHVQRSASCMNCLIVSHVGLEMMLVYMDTLNGGTMVMSPLSRCQRHGRHDTPRTRTRALSLDSDGAEKEPRARHAYLYIHAKGATHKERHAGRRQFALPGELRNAARGKACGDRSGPSRV